jgi:hypothetical protein
VGPNENGKQYVEMGGLPLPMRFQPFKSVLTLENDGSDAQQLGIKPDADRTNGWAAAVWGRQVLFVASHKIESEGAYFGGGSQVEVFSANEALGSYLQLEISSPVRRLQKGQTLRSDEVWQLLTLDAGAARDREKVGQAAGEAHKAALELLGKP